MDIQLGHVTTTEERYREVSRIRKAELATRIVNDPGHIYPPLNVVQRWTKDELITHYIELTSRH